MRNGQNNNNKRMRNNNSNRNSNSGGGNNNSNNNNRRGQNPMTRVFESNGPDIKIRGTASHVAEKYVQLARDARSSGDPVAAENYYQHAEHYFRLIAAAQEQFRQNQPQPRTENEMASEDSDDDGETFSNFGAEPGFVTPPPQPFVPRDPPPREQPQQREQQPYQPRENQQYQPREAREPRENIHREPRPQHQPQPQPQPAMPVSDSVDRLPSFITGPQPLVNGPAPFDAAAGERFPPRRRRRPHGPRPEGAAPAPVTPGDDFGNS
ncbi:DUF4167 domain-containing protein [Tardiphaga sp.]|uniref:DUF4167 domain-containing protein n=1 Tax=Tardiphaga sp. TaxID=1926292 RepID=UPI0026065DCC|nr:DUF4167 domain-containing protein [Tardiphaga sp.]MDB5617195.1 hypothetical protein [Tardiphaga sp.]